ncbi:MAG: DUF4431 domain-containing protein [Parvularculaceae bacterium]
MGALRLLQWAAAMAVAAVTAVGAQGAQLGERDFHYGDTVTLAGTLSVEERSTARNAADRVYLLALDAPMTVIGDPMNAFNTGTVHGVIEIQLTRSARISFRDLVDRRVRATGELFPRRSAHHHTPVLMMVSKIEALDS